eukprot:XP_001700025.1 predicted protein [Chlamydomonas reinhardtii]
MAPLAEELVFRRVLLDALVPAPSPVPVPEPAAAPAEESGATLAEATVFAAYHLNANEMLPQAALGGVLGWAYLASGRNLAVTLMGHTMYNGAAVALLLFQR